MAGRGGSGDHFSLEEGGAFQVQGLLRVTGIEGPGGARTALRCQPPGLQPCWWATPTPSPGPTAHTGVDDTPRILK